MFRGYSPGSLIQGSSLRSRLKDVFSTRAARLGTLHESTKLRPVSIIADALGYHPSHHRVPRQRLCQRVLAVHRRKMGRRVIPRGGTDGHGVPLSRPLVSVSP